MDAAPAPPPSNKHLETASESKLGYLSMTEKPTGQSTTPLLEQFDRQLHPHRTVQRTANNPHRTQSDRKPPPA